MGRGILRQIRAYHGDLGVEIWGRRMVEPHDAHESLVRRMDESISCGLMRTSTFKGTCSGTIIIRTSPAPTTPPTVWTESS
ncbi:hypothetical protein J2W42_006711 [Rhizobium tibeticum]|nr:hypothetical protein [Rhizobium tibeticum]